MVLFSMGFAIHSTANLAGRPIRRHFAEKTIFKRPDFYLSVELQELLFPLH